MFGVAFYIEPRWWNTRHLDSDTAPRTTTVHEDMRSRYSWKHKLCYFIGPGHGHAWLPRGKQASTKKGSPRCVLSMTIFCCRATLYLDGLSGWLGTKVVVITRRSHGITAGLPTSSSLKAYGRFQPMGVHSLRVDVIRCSTQVSTPTFVLTPETRRLHHSDTQHQQLIYAPRLNTRPLIDSPGCLTIRLNYPRPRTAKTLYDSRICA